MPMTVMTVGKGHLELGRGVASSTYHIVSSRCTPHIVHHSSSLPSFLPLTILSRIPAPTVMPVDMEKLGGAIARFFLTILPIIVAPTVVSPVYRQAWGYKGSFYHIICNSCSLLISHRCLLPYLL